MLTAVEGAASSSVRTAAVVLVTHSTDRPSHPSRTVHLLLAEGTVPMWYQVGWRAVWTGMHPASRRSTRASQTATTQNWLSQVHIEANDGVCCCSVALDIFLLNSRSTATLAVAPPPQSVKYNIPVAIWLPERYPLAGPLAYVVPTPDMVIKPRHTFVDASGVPQQCPPPGVCPRHGVHRFLAACQYGGRFGVKLLCRAGVLHTLLAALPAKLEIFAVQGWCTRRTLRSGSIPPPICASWHRCAACGAATVLLRELLTTMAVGAARGSP